MNLKENEERCIGSFQRKNVKGEWCNLIITPKVKKIHKNKNCKGHIKYHIMQYLGKTGI